MKIRKKRKSELACPNFNAYFQLRVKGDSFVHFLSYLMFDICLGSKETPLLI